VLEHVARVGFAVDDDHVRLDLGDAFGQEDIGRQRGDDVVAGFQQPDAQRRVARAWAASASAPATPSPAGVVLMTTMRRVRAALVEAFMPWEYASSGPVTRSKIFTWAITGVRMSDSFITENIHKTYATHHELKVYL
jgi:hypothetical protein